MGCFTIKNVLLFFLPGDSVSQISSYLSRKVGPVKLLESQVMGDRGTEFSSEFSYFQVFFGKIFFLAVPIYTLHR